MKDKRRKIATYILIALILTSSLMTGCTSNAETKETVSSVAIVIGAHRNSMALNLNSELIRDNINNCISSGGLVSVISCDGVPEVISGKKYEVKEQYKGNRELLEQISNQEATNLLKSLQEVRADDAEIDTLEALRLAVRTLSSAPEGTKSIVICDTGLSTIGLLDFRNNLIGAEPSDIVEQLERKAAIPDFTDIKIVWQQMGDLYEPQQTLTPTQSKNLRAIWKEIIEKGGGVFEATDIISNPGSVTGNLPEVTVVELPTDSPIKISTADNDFNTPHYLSEEQVRFIADTDKYFDSEQAEKAIHPIADYMKKEQEVKMLLVGTTAGDDNTDFSITLSENRAEAVKKTLISMGVEEKRIVCLGLGCEDPWHIPNVGTGDGLAANNRKVVILKADSDIAKTLLN